MTVRYEFLVKTPGISDGMKVAVEMDVINQLTARHKHYGTKLFNPAKLLCRRDCKD